jgi:hypothetical protein
MTHGPQIVHGEVSTTSRMAALVYFVDRLFDQLNQADVVEEVASDFVNRVLRVNRWVGLQLPEPIK